MLCTAGILLRYRYLYSLFFFILFFILFYFLYISSGGWVKVKLKLPHFHVSDTFSCFDLTHAPVATTARAAATGPVSTSTRPYAEGSDRVETNFKFPSPESTRHEPRPLSIFFCVFISIPRNSLMMKSPGPPGPYTTIPSR